MKSTLIRWLIVLNLLGLCLYGLSYLYKRTVIAKETHDREKSLTARIAKVDTISTDDFSRLRSIAKNATGNSTLSNSDLTFVLSQFAKKHSGKNSATAILYSVLILKNTDISSDSQKQTVYSLLTPLLSSKVRKDIFVDANKSAACYVLARFGIKESIPQILPLLNDPSKKVQTSAKKALAKLGYSAS